MKSAKTPAAARNDIAGTLARLQPMPRLTDVRQVRAELVLSGEAHPCLPTPRRQGLSRMQPRRMHPAHLVNLGDGPDRGVGRCGWNVVSAEPEPELRMLRVQAALGPGLAREGIRITWVAALQRFKTKDLRAVCAYSQRRSAVRASRSRSERPRETRGLRAA